MIGEFFSDYSEFGDIINWVLNYYEKMDGSGYFLYFEKEYLIFVDWIIFIVDIFIVLIEDCFYCKGMVWQEVLQIMEVDVINGVLDSDVFFVLCYYVEMLYVIIFQIFVFLYSECCF